MREDFVDIPVQVKLMMTANTLPSMGGSGVDGIWRRMKLVTFGRAIAGERVLGYAQILLETEGPGFLNWCLAGLAHYREHGLVDPDAMRAAVADYQAEEDVTGQFAAACLEQAGDEVWLANADLMTAYAAWCRENGHRPEDGRQVGKWLKQARYTAARPLKARRTGLDGGTETRAHRGWLGVRLDVERAGGFLAEKPWEPVGDPQPA
jgi:putative DNA primase/helicase